MRCPYRLLVRMPCNRESEAEVKYSEQKNIVAEIREKANALNAIADFLEQPKCVELPKPSISIYTNTTVSNYEWVEEEDGNSDYKDNFWKTHQQMVDIARILKPVEKNYNNSDLTLVKKFGSIKLAFSASREAVCRKVQVGTEKKEKVEYPIVRTGIMEEVPVYEWQCDPLLS